jgi:hypothetical protein
VVYRLLGRRLERGFKHGLEHSSNLFQQVWLILRCRIHSVAFKSFVEASISRFSMSGRASGNQNDICKIRYDIILGEAS